jgi:serine/threonine-protein kinase
VLAIAALVLAVLVAAGFTLWPSGSSTVPDVVGMSADDATAALREAGLTARTAPVDTPDAKAGDVVTQDPPADSVEPNDGVVDLQIASGEVTVSAADLIGRPYAEAAEALEKLGLTVARTDQESTATAGDVVALDRSGRMVLGSTVTVSVAVAPQVETQSGGSDTPVAEAPSTAATDTDAKPGKQAKDKKPKTENKGKGNGKGNGKG